MERATGDFSRLKHVQTISETSSRFLVTRKRGRWRHIQVSETLMFAISVGKLRKCVIQRSESQIIFCLQKIPGLAHKPFRTGGTTKAQTCRQTTTVFRLQERCTPQRQRLHGKFHILFGPFQFYTWKIVYPRYFFFPVTRIPRNVIRQTHDHRFRRLWNWPEYANKLSKRCAMLSYSNLNAHIRAKKITNSQVKD